MAKLQLMPNEVIILKETNVAHGGVMAINNDDLILTNLNIIYVDKGILGNQKEIIYYPLKTLKTYNGVPQVEIGHLSTGRRTLEFNFSNGIEVFHFDNLPDQEYDKWVDTIKGIITRNDNNVNSNTYSSEIMKTDEFTREIGVLKDEYRGLGKELIGAFAFKPAEGTENKATSKKCISCSAPLAGRKGMLVKCKYCDTEQVL